jgi:type II restriction enzyme
MDTSGAGEFKSNSQRARAVTEAWAATNLYCAACDSDRLSPYPNNTRAADFECPKCKAPYQLKSGKKWSKDRVMDSGYEAMMGAIKADKTPHLLVMQYVPQAGQTWAIKNLLLVPKFFFTASAVEKRKPLGPDARRAGYVGCNILLKAIADDGKLPVVERGVADSAANVRARYEKVRPLEKVPVELRGWALDVFTCVSRVGKPEFTLAEVYAFEDYLSALHPENNNVRPKIRQQLQVLRDAGLLEFTGRGRYALKP